MLASSANAAAIGSAGGALSQFPPDADWQTIAARLHESNCALAAQAEALQAILQQQQQELDVRAVKLLSLEETQATKATEAASALQACQARDREQLRAIATLSERLEISQARAQQLERECLALQATCREQVERTTCAQKEIQELHARLQQQQQQTARAQKALERHLAERAPDNNRSNAWPPPLIQVPGSGDRLPVKAAMAVAPTPATTTVAVSVDPWEKAQSDDPTDARAPVEASPIEAAPELEFPFDAFLEPIEPESEMDWIAPSVQSQPTKKKHKTLATILLPEF